MEAEANGTESTEQPDEPKKKAKLKDAFEAALGRPITVQPIAMLHPKDITTDYDEEHPLYNQGRTEEPLDQGFVLNIFARGVLKNVLVRIVGSKVEVVDGARTVMHARAATAMRESRGLEPILVPVTLRRGEVKEQALDQVSANQFSKPEAEVLQKARRAAHLLNMGVDEETVVLAFGGVSIPTLRSWMKLLTLSPKILDAVDKNRITAAVALEWVDKDAGEQAKAFQEAMATIAAGGSVSAKGLQRQRVVKEKGEKRLRPSSGHLRKLVKVIDEGGAPQLAKNVGFYAALNWVLGGGESVVAGVPGLEDAWKAVLAPKPKKAKKAEAGEKEGKSDAKKPKAGKKAAAAKPKPKKAAKPKKGASAARRRRSERRK